MAEVNGTIIAKELRDGSSGDSATLQTIYDDVALQHRLKMEATGVTFNGTLDPTNLALEDGNLAALRIGSTPTLGTTQKVAVAAAHAETTNTIGVTSVYIVSTTNCHVVVADAPVATANDFYLPANVPLRIKCATTNKVSVIRDTADGSLYVTGLS